MYTIFPRNLAGATFYFKPPFGGANNSRAASTEIAVVSLPCGEGGIYWDELVDRCGDISRVAGFQGAVRFRGNTVCTKCYNLLM